MSTGVLPEGRSLTWRTLDASRRPAAPVVRGTHGRSRHCSTPQGFAAALALSLERFCGMRRFQRGFCVASDAAAAQDPGQ